MVRTLTGLAVVLSSCSASVTPPATGSPSRIVSLAPSITEVLFEVGLGPRVAGVTSYCTFPEEATRLPKVGGYLTPSLEAIAALRPDLVVVLPEHADVAPNLEALGLTTMRVDHGSLSGVIDSIETLGAFGGTTERARAVAEELRDLLTRPHEAARTAQAPPRVLLVVARSDDASRFHVAASDTIHHDLILAAGGRNALSSDEARYPTLSLEGVARLDPDVIVEFALAGSNLPGLRAQWRAHTMLRAVRSDRVHVFAEDYLPVPGPRFVRFASVLAEALHE